MPVCWWRGIRPMCSANFGMNMCAFASGTKCEWPWNCDSRNGWRWKIIFSWNFNHFINFLNFFKDFKVSSFFLIQFLPWLSKLLLNFPFFRWILPFMPKGVAHRLCSNHFCNGTRFMRWPALVLSLYSVRHLSTIGHINNSDSVYNPILIILRFFDSLLR